MFDQGNMSRVLQKGFSEFL